MAVNNTPVSLASDKELLEELASRARSTPGRAFIGAYLTPDDTQFGKKTSVWFSLSAGDDWALNQVMLEVCARIGLGSAAVAPDLAALLLPRGEFVANSQEIVLTPRLTALHLAGVFAACGATSPTVPLDNQLFGQMKKLMTALGFEIVPTADPLLYHIVNASRTLTARMEVSVCWKLSSV